MENIINTELATDLLSNKVKREVFMALYEESLGKDNNLICKLKANHTMIATCMDNNKIIGFLIFFIAKSADRVKRTIGNKPLKSEIEYPVGVFDGVGIVRHSGRKELATELFQIAEDYFIKERVNSVITAAIEYKGIVPASIALTKLGYQRLERIDSPWKTECDTGEYCCLHRDHKNRRCICNAVVYYKTDLMSQKQILVA